MSGQGQRRVTLFVRAMFGGREAPSATVIEHMLRKAGAEHTALHMGEGVSASFGTRTAALNAAVLLHQRFRRPDSRVAVAIDVGDPTGKRTAMLAETATAGVTIVTSIVADGLDPPPRRAFRPIPSRGLEEQLFELAPAREVIPHNLPVTTGNFVGREGDLARARAKLDEAPMLTLTGPPGTGKTRMGIELADDVLGRFPDGAYFIPMAALGDPELVVDRIADAIGVSVVHGRRIEELLEAALVGRRILLVIDNMEHLLSAARMLASLASVSTGVRLLVTSRVRLNVAPEFEYRLAPLAVPERDSVPGLRALRRVASARLFLDRAREAGASAGIREDGAPAIAELCRRLDGLPLAIELAAARLRFLSPEALLNTLEDRFTLLGSEQRDRPERQRTLRGAVSWSYELLGEPEQAVFRRLAVFRGTFSLAAVEAIAMDADADRARVLDLIATLVDQNLVQVAHTNADEPRFLLLETLREAAAERLSAAGEDDTVRERHARYYAGVAGRPTAVGSAEDTAKQAVMRREHENLRAAFEWSIAGHHSDLAAALSLGSATMHFGSGQLTEGRRWLDALVGIGDTLPAVVRAHAVTTQGRFAFWQGDLPAAEAAYVVAVAAWRELENGAELARVLVDSAWPPILSEGRSAHDLARAAAAAEEGLAVARRSGSTVEEARALWTLGAIASLRETADDAERLAEQAASLLRATGERYWLALVLVTLGIFRQAKGNLIGSRGAAREALTVTGDLHPWVTPLILDHLAGLALDEGDAIRAARLAAAAATHKTAMGANMGFIVNRLAGRRGPRGPAEDSGISRAWREGQLLSLEAAVEYALSESVGDEGVQASSRAALRIRSLGTFEAEASGQLIRHWGGEKAGARHAQAMFGFLFDRGARGVSKDEFQEVIWPDADMEKADVALHRTLGGLRRTLAGATGIPYGETVQFANDRYRLGAGVVEWSDLGAFEEKVELAHRSLDDTEAIALLEEANKLVWGDFLDDCPFYGDSPYVEERRQQLRERHADLLVELAERYEADGDIQMARTRFRAALDVSLQTDPRAREGLARLAVRS